MAEEKNLKNNNPIRKKKKNLNIPGFGTVYQRGSDNRWVASFKVEETGKKKDLYGKTQEEAYALLQKAYQDQKQGILAIGPKQKLAGHLNWWLDEVKKQKLRESSYIRYRQALDTYIIPVLGDIQLQKLTTQQIQTFYNNKQKEGLSPSSIITMHKVLHQGLEYAVRIHLISHNPSNSASLPKQTKRKVKPLTMEQARHLLKIAKGHSLEVFIILALTTGMRHGELIALRWEDVNLEQGSVYVHRTAAYYGKSKFIEGDPKTEMSERTLPISKIVCDILTTHKVRQNEIRLKVGPAWKNLDLVFCNRTGGFLIGATVRGSFYPLLNKAGLPLMHIHDLRHTASTLFQSMGVNPKTVQEMLGHSEMSQTFDYTHALPSMQREAVEKMDNLFL